VKPGDHDPWDSGGDRAPVRRAPWMLVLAMVVAVAAGAALFLTGRAPDRIEGDDASKAAPLAGTHAATLYFSDREGRSLVPEERELPEGDHFEARVEAVLGALVTGPLLGDALPVLPESARLLRVFFDADTGTLYADFDAALVRDHPGGSTAEWKTWTAMVRTLRANFPEVRRLQLLVQGEPIETLAGHFDASRPVDLDTWQ